MELKSVTLCDENGPDICSRCDDELNGVYFTELELFKGFIIMANFCHHCVDELKKRCKQNE